MSISIRFQTGAGLDGTSRTITNVADPVNATDVVNKQFLTKTNVGLGSVDNTTDILKPISIATQNALDGKSSLASPTFTGTPVAPTPVAGTNTTQVATTAFVMAANANIDTLPTTNTLAQRNSLGYLMATDFIPNLENRIFVFGRNDDYVLGVDNKNDVLSPQLISTYSNNLELPTYTDGATGQIHTMVIKTDGSLWSCGTNINGQLGGGTTINTSSFIQVGNLTDWKQVACAVDHSIAIKTDGTLWSWGYNGSIGLLGDNTVISKSSPIQVGSLTNWKQVSCRGNFTTVIKTDGSIWSWGYNNFGQLGDGTITNKNSPVQVGNLTTWQQVSSGSAHTMAIKTNGSLWSWGYNQYGQLGDGTIIHKSSPIQVGSLTNWKRIIGGTNHTIGIMSSNL